MAEKHVNVVFKWGDRLVMSENPKSIEAAVKDTTRLFGIRPSVTVQFFVNIPHHGMAELAPSSWKNIEYGTVIEVELSNSEPSAWKPARLSQASRSETSELMNMESYRPSVTASEKTAYEPLESTEQNLSGFDIEKMSFRPDHESKEVDLTTRATTVSVHVELPAEIPSPNTVVVEVNRVKGLQVLFGNVADWMACPTEQVQLWLLRDGGLTRISPLSSPDDVGLIDGDRIRVRVRVRLTRPSPSPTPAQFPISWNDSFNKPRSPFPKGPTLPKSPAFGRALKTTPLELSNPPKRVSRPSQSSTTDTHQLRRMSASWNLKVPVMNISLDQDL